MTIKKMLKTKIVPKGVVEVMKQTLLTMVKIGDYRCTICGVPMRGPDNIIVQHFGGKKHRQKAKRWSFPDSIVSDEEGNEINNKSDPLATNLCKSSEIKCSGSFFPDKQPTQKNCQV